MSDRVIEQADLRTIEHNLGAIHNDLQTLDSNVGAPVVPLVCSDIPQ